MTMSSIVRFFKFTIGFGQIKIGTHLFRNLRTYFTLLKNNFIKL